MTPTRFENLATHIVFVRFDLKSSEMLRRIDWQTDTDVSKALRSFETSTTVYQSIPRNISEGLNLKQINDPTDSILGPPPPCCSIWLLLFIYYITGYQTLFVPIRCAFKKIACPSLMKSAQCLLIRLLKRSSSMVNLLPASFIISVGPKRYRNSVP